MEKQLQDASRIRFDMSPVPKEVNTGIKIGPLSLILDFEISRH